MTVGWLELDPRYVAAMQALLPLLERSRVGHAFVGDVASNAWLGEPVRGSIDLLALISPERGSTIPQLAPSHGFRVDRDEAEKVRELDLLPIHHMGEAEIRINVLMATNALYSNMIARSELFELPPEHEVHVISAADHALLLRVAGDERSAALFARLLDECGERIDRMRFNRSLRSIGLARLEVHE